MDSATKRFIEDALLGDWSYPEDPHRVQNMKFMRTGVRFWTQNEDGDDSVGFFVAYAETLLDPLAWQAVGKVRGWFDGCGSDCATHGIAARQHQFFIELCNGKSIEEALLAIE